MPLHKKFNQKIADPNPYFTFVSVLKRQDAADEKAALDLLRALAAQVKPLCKDHGLGVNSFEEAPWNPEHAGRNWNGGEVVEIVLRSPSGRFMPMGWLIHVVCHELAHIKQMNHSPAFQKVNNEYRQQVRALQARGYFGDGLWSSGHRLSDSANVEGIASEPSDFPELLCGGAAQRSRGKGSRGRRSTLRRQKAYQVVKPNSRASRKAGSRIKGDFEGEGTQMSRDPEKSTFRKRAQSKSARELRAIAAEKRMAAAQGASKDESDTDDESKVKFEDLEEEEGDLNFDRESKLPRSSKDKEDARGKGKAKAAPGSEYVYDSASESEEEGPELDVKTRDALHDERQSLFNWLQKGKSSTPSTAQPSRPQANATTSGPRSKRKAEAGLLKEEGGSEAGKNASSKRKVIVID